MGPNLVERNPPFVASEALVQIVPNMEETNPHVVVVGAGFGGLTFCQTFKHRAARVTLFDRPRCKWPDMSRG
jgi:NADPH-dependent 2,4-dienoyl-CoA reductase/sulfur reductase-like enzyme